MKKFILISLLFILTCYSLLEFSFNFRESAPYDFIQREWIHHAGLPENSIEGLNSTLKAGYRGIEIDVHYLADEKKFILTHDMPSKTPRLELEDFLKNLNGEDAQLWLDLKNPSIQHVFEAAEILKELAEKYNLQNKIIVESQNHLHQIILSRLQIPSILWVNFFSNSRLYFFRNFLNRFSIIAGNFIGISFPIESWQQRPQVSYKNLTKLIFTVNDQQMIEKLKKDPTVKVILKDLPTTPALPR